MNPHPHVHKGTNGREGMIESGAIIFRKQSIPTLLAICEYVGEVKRKEVDVELMIFTIDRLKEITGR